MKQRLTFDLDLPSLAQTGRRVHWSRQVEDKQAQQDRVREMLDAMGVRPVLPCRVLLVRVAGGCLDDDNLQSALKYVRDTVARWAHRLQETVPEKDDRGNFVLRRGHAVMTRPRAPDGPRDGIEWRYGQRRSRAPKVANGEPKAPAPKSIEIVIYDGRDIEDERRTAAE